MNKSAIIIEDEPRAIKVIENYLKKVPEIVHMGSFREPLEAIRFLRLNKVDLIFLDINLPDITGFQLLDKLNHVPKIIFTTAYDQYAVEGYNYEPIDYLLKPISFNRFLNAIEKFLKRTSTSVFSDLDNVHYVYLKSGTKSYRIRQDDILYLEKDGHYVRFMTKDKLILSRLNMKEIFQIIPESKFIRIHKSFIVNKSSVDVLESHQLTIGKKKLPIGASYKSVVESTFPNERKSGQ